MDGRASRQHDRATLRVVEVNGEQDDGVRAVATLSGSRRGPSRMRCRRRSSLHRPVSMRLFERTCTARYIRARTVACTGLVKRGDALRLSAWCTHKDNRVRVFARYMYHALMCGQLMLYHPTAGGFRPAPQTCLEPHNSNFRPRHTPQALSRELHSFAFEPLLVHAGPHGYGGIEQCIIQC